MLLIIWILMLLVWEIDFFLRVELKIYEYSSFYFLGNDIWFFIVNFWRFEEIEYNSRCNLGVLLCYGCYNFD